jgi:hypothetical protein
VLEEFKEFKELQGVENLQHDAEIELQGVENLRHGAEIKELQKQLQDVHMAALGMFFKHRPLPF